MRIEVEGSSPEFGSSQKRYLGFNAMALAMPTLFCIPPLNSEGIFLFTFSRFTLFRQKFTRSIFCSRLQSVKKFIGNMTFSSTVAKSKRALPWKSIPISLCSSFLDFESSAVSSLFSYHISPPSGLYSPTKVLSNTVLPEPLAPIISEHSPGLYSMDISERTGFPSKDLYK